MASLDGIFVDLERVAAVLEVVTDLHRFSGEFSGLADGDESGVQAISEGGSEDKAASFHAEYDKDPAGSEAEFLRGDLAGWRDTLHTLYHDCAEEIVDRVLAKTCLAFPETLIHSSAPREDPLIVNGR